MEEIKVKLAALEVAQEKTTTDMTRLIATQESFQVSVAAEHKDIHAKLARQKDALVQSNNNAQSILWNFRDEIKDYINERLEKFSEKFGDLKTEINDKIDANKKEMNEHIETKVNEVKSEVKDLNKSMQKVTNKQTLIFGGVGIVIFLIKLYLDYGK
jgi:DNA anti-recombination protein RmuC